MNKASINNYLLFIRNLLDNYIFCRIDRLLKRPNIDNGLRELSSKKIVKKGDYVYNVYGVTGKRVIKEDGNFLPYFNEGEQQNDPFEKMFCVSENGIANSIEANFNYFIHLEKNNKADEETLELLKIFKYFNLIKNAQCLLDTEYIAVGSGTTRRGNSYNNIANFIRHYGLVPKGSWPAYNTWNEMYYPSGACSWVAGNKVPNSLLERGKKVVEFIDITYEWIGQKDFNSAIKRGAFGTSCYGWGWHDDNGIYQRVELPRNHAVTKPCKAGETYQKIKDSYKPFTKKLALNYNLGYGMLISFRVKKPLNIYNEKYLKKLKEKGWDYILLINDVNENYTQGAYKLSANMIEKVDDIKPFIDNGIIRLKEKGKLEGISTEDFKKIFI